MSHLKRIDMRWVLMLVMMGLAAGGLSSASRTLAQDPGDWRPVTIVYNADVVGKIEPCG